MKQSVWIAMWALVASATAGAAHAAEIGHYVPGLLNIREFFVPEPGVYGGIYNYFYTTEQLNDPDGDEIDSITIAPRGGPGVTLDVDVDVDLYALAPMFIWVSDWRPFGIKYSAAVAPTFANTSVHAALSTVTGRGGRVKESDFNVGDLLVVPVWLGWTPEHFDLALGYGFYAPTGEYDTQRVTLPGGRAVEVESPDNIGLGFWTQQIQGAAAWYPWKSKGTAVVTALTYENHQDKDDFDLEPGDNLSLNWGLSQFLPLTKDQKLLLEVGASGYDSWQITDDSGSDATDTAHDQVHAVGGQIGLTYVPWMLAFNFHGLHEFAAEDRFQGDSFVVSLLKGF